MDNSLTVAALADRIDRLERAGRRWRWLATGLAVLVLAAAGPATRPASDEVRTHRLVLVDGQDRPAAVFQYRPGETGGLTFVDPAHPDKVASSFGWASDGSGDMEINTHDGRTVIQQTGTVNEKGVPVEQAKEARDRVNHILSDR